MRSLQDKLVAQMEKTSDPMLKAFLHRTDRSTVDQVLLATYGPQKASRKKDPKKAAKKKKSGKVKPKKTKKQ